MNEYINYIELFSKRLNQLSKDHIEKKKNEYIQYNDEIDRENRRNKEKSKIDKTFLYRQKDRLKNYTKKEMIEEISTLYGEDIKYQAFNLYTKGERFPDLNIVKACADYFNVSFEYMCGMTDNPNELNSKIQGIINLNENAINTLISYNNKPIAQSVINGLLNDAESSNLLFINMYEHMYQIYKRSKSLGKLGEYDQTVIFKKFMNSDALNRYLEKHLLPLVSNSFEKRLINENEEDLWKSENYAEYERENIDAIAKFYEKYD